MTVDSKRALARAVLDRYGTTFGNELGFTVERNTPSALFRLLCFSLLASARISGTIALRAAKAMSDEGWTTAKAMAASTWRARAEALKLAGYARYDERTSTMLGETASLLLDTYGGDLRKLREEAGRDPRAERALLKAFKGMGDVGVDIYFREVQGAWDELYPFADKRSLKAARRLGLPDSAAGLRPLVSRRDFPRFVAGLVRVDQGKADEEIVTAARK